MDSDLVKAGIKGVAALFAIVVGGTLAKRGYEDYKRSEENKQLERQEAQEV